MSRHPGLVLAACSLGMSLILMDTTVVNVAAPAIRDDLDASASTLQWVINAYTLMFAALLLSMGALSDRLGARRVFLAGLVTFAAGSAAAGAAPSAAALIAAQAVLGVGAALVLPTSLALLVYTYPEPVRRARAVGVWAAGQRGGVRVGAGDRRCADGRPGLALDLHHQPSARPAGGVARLARGAAGARGRDGARRRGRPGGDDRSPWAR